MDIIEYWVIQMVTIQQNAGLVRLLIFWNTADIPLFSMLMLRQHALLSKIC